MATFFRHYFWGLFIDAILAVSIVLGNFYYNYRLPHPLNSLDIPTASAPTTLSSESLATHFSDETQITPNSYRSPNLSITITHNAYTSSRKDYDGESAIAYTVADIYVRDVRCIQTAFAKDTFGVGYREPLESTAEKIGAILAVNGDTYSNNHRQYNGTIIRNGILYRASAATEDSCVLFKDGSMRTIAPDELNSQQLVEDGAWQSWMFGPSLLDSHGNAILEYNVNSYLLSNHPRTGIGYYEPGHYCLVVVDGRQDGYSRGMYMDEFARLFQSLGCKLAYNLDGGHCSYMTFFSDIVTHPYTQTNDITDGIYLC